MSIDREQRIGQEPELTSPEAAARFMDFITDPENFSIPFHDGYKSAFEITPEMRQTREWELGIAFANGGVSLMKAKFLKSVVMNGYGPDVYLASKWIAKVIDFDPNTHQIRPQTVEKTA